MGFFSTTPASSSTPAPMVDALPTFWPPLGLDPAFSATQQTVLSIKVRPSANIRPGHDRRVCITDHRFHPRPLCLAPLAQPATFGPDWTIVDQEGKTVVLYKGDGKTRGEAHPISYIVLSGLEADRLSTNFGRDPASAHGRADLPATKHEDLRHTIRARLEWRRSNRDD